MACRCSSLSSVALLAFFLGGGGLESKNLRNKNLSLGNTSKNLEIGLDFIIIVLRNRVYVYIPGQYCRLAAIAARRRRF